ncbi:MAG: HDIG domain-containing metalloprotein [Anaerolineae bacterium]
MTRDEALTLVRQLIKNRNLVKHHLAVEAVMRALARHFGEDEETWGLAGLLHDADYEVTEKDPLRHGLVIAEKLEELGVDPIIVRAVKSHNDQLGVSRETRMEKALYACDELTGLIVAAALVHPQRKLAALDTRFVMNRFKEKSFARGARREQIRTCSELGFELEDFVRLNLAAMQGIAQDLGL